METTKTKWVVRGDKGQTQIVIQCDQIDKLLVASMHLKAMGYKVKTLNLERKS